MGVQRVVTHDQTKLVFCSPNARTDSRVDTFSTKEPETLEWIDGFEQGAIFWDIGANVGLYSCYAAKARSCQVFAFEPSIFNVELLARNIFLNELTESVVMVPLPLSESLTLNTLNMTRTEWGGALSTFGQDFGWDGKKLQAVFKFQTIGVSADECLRLFKLPRPQYLKLDVDGIEHLVLQGSVAILRDVDSVLVEINDAFGEQSKKCDQLLVEAGLILKQKRRSEMFEGGTVWNQIWVRI